MTLTAIEFRKVWQQKNPNVIHIPSEYELGLMEAYAQYYHETKVTKLNKADVVGSGDLIERNLLIDQFKKSKSYYEGIDRFDYSAGFEKAIYLTANLGKKMEF